MLAILQSGDWLTPERCRGYARILLALATLAVIALVAVPNGGIGPDDLPLGTDFSQVWVAGREALAGAPDAPYDLARHIAAQRAEFGERTGIFGWHYPPYFLLVAALLARLPYLPALAVWQGATLLAYLFVMVPLLAEGGVRRREAIVVALAFPAVLVNITHGQNGFLTAALLGGGFLLLDRRPVVSGALFALLAYKPQFILVLPLALLLERRWRALFSAAATLLLMTAASVAAFGLDVWRGFFESLGFTRRMAEEGATGFEKIQSVFAGVRLLGGGVELAYFLQSAVAAGALAALAWLLLTQGNRRVKGAATIVALFLTTPYVLDYDMVALAPALAFLVAHGAEEGFAPFQKSLLAAAYVAPLVVREVAGAANLPLGAILILLLFASIVRLSQRRAFQRISA